MDARRYDYMMPGVKGAKVRAARERALCHCSHGAGCQRTLRCALRVSVHMRFQSACMLLGDRVCVVCECSHVFLECLHDAWRQRAPRTLLVRVHVR